MHIPGKFLSLITPPQSIKYYVYNKYMVHVPPTVTDSQWPGQKKKKFPVFHGTRTFITMIINLKPGTNPSHFNSIHSLTHYFLKTNFNTVFPSTEKKNRLLHPTKSTEYLIKDSLFQNYNSEQAEGPNPSKKQAKFIKHLLSVSPAVS